MVYSKTDGETKTRRHVKASSSSLQTPTATGVCPTTQRVVKRVGAGGSQPNFWLTNSENLGDSQLLTASKPIVYRITELRLPEDHQGSTCEKLRARPVTLMGSLCFWLQLLLHLLISSRVHSIVCSDIKGSFNITGEPQRTRSEESDERSTLQLDSLS